MQLKNIREALKEVFDAVEEALKETGIDYYLIGAQARDHWYSKGGKTARITNDVDFAILVGSEKDYQVVRNYLSEYKSFQSTKENSFVMLTPGGTQVDILPFGEFEIDDATEIAGLGLTSIKVNGFMEVYQSGTEEIEMGTSHQFKIATLPGIILLKLIAYDDRPEHRAKDAADIADILKHFFELQSDLIYSDHSDLFNDSVDETTELAEISALVIGREIKKIIGANEKLLERIKGLLDKYIQQKEKSAFVRTMIQNVDESIEQKIKLLSNIRSAL
jgi:predicted nucleotidyltransferase